MCSKYVLTSIAVSGFTYRTYRFFILFLLLPSKQNILFLMLCIHVKHLHTAYSEIWMKMSSLFSLSFHSKVLIGQRHYKLTFCGDSTSDLLDIKQDQQHVWNREYQFEPYNSAHKITVSVSSQVYPCRVYIRCYLFLPCVGVRDSEAILISVKRTETLSGWLISAQSGRRPKFLDRQGGGWLTEEKRDPNMYNRRHKKPFLAHNKIINLFHSSQSKILSGKQCYINNVLYHRLAR